jgi:hypothetical protein
MTTTAITTSVPFNQFIQGGINFDSTGSKAYFFSKPVNQPGFLYQMDAATKAIPDSLETTDWHGGLKAVTVTSNQTMYMTYWGIWPNEHTKIYIGNANGMDLTDSVTTAFKPYTMVERPGTNELWVVCHSDAKIDVLDKANNLASLKNIAVGANPKTIVFTEDVTDVSNVAASNAAWAVYPNPGNGIFYIEGKDAHATYTIADISGRTIKSGKIDTSTTVDLVNYPAGIYMMQISSNKAVQNVKLVKN